MCFECDGSKLDIHNFKQKIMDIQLPMKGNYWAKFKGQDLCTFGMIVAGQEQSVRPSAEEILPSNLHELFEDMMKIDKSRVRPCLFGLQ